MYGVLKNAACRLPPVERQRWAGHFCGVCLGLRDRFGQLSRLLTNYDSALVVALCDAQSDRPIDKINSRCLLRRPVAAQVDDPDEAAVGFGASMALLIAGIKIRDNLEDDRHWGRGIRRALSSQARRWQQAAEACMGAVGFNAARVEREFSRQSEVEKRRDQKFEFYSQPTETAVGEVFAHTAVLERRPVNFEPLIEIGRLFGRIMLLLDSYRDFASDAEAGRFNALAAAYPGQGWQLPARELFRQSYRGLREGFSLLEVPQPDLLQSLLVKHLGQVGCRSLGICRASQETGPGWVRSAAGAPGPAVPLASNFQDLGNDEGPIFDGSSSSPDDRPCKCLDCSSCCLNRPRQERNVSQGQSGCCAQFCYSSQFCIDCGQCFNCGQCDTSHCDCGGCDCSHCDCSGCDCSHCDCSGCCDCSHCDCGGCDCNCS